MNTEIKPTSITLPPIGLVLKKSLLFTIHRLDLLICAILVGMIIVPLYHTDDFFLQAVGFFLDSILGGVLMYVCYQNRRASFYEGVCFIFSNFFAWLWIYILCAVVILMGLVFIVPSAVAMVF